MIEIGLSPKGRLRWIDSGDGNESSMSSLQRTFESDWREGLFRLSAEKFPVQESITLRFWKEFTDRYLTALSHIPESVTAIEIKPLTEAEAGRFALNAPPMIGGEYLNPDTIGDLWNLLDAWCRKTVSRYDGPSAFLRERAPEWNQVGRVCFHLAENKDNRELPFAFMASYSSGFSSTGRVKYLPLYRALHQYSSQNEKQTLINLLTPVHKAAEKCSWVHRLVQNGEIYKPLLWRPAQAWAFLKTSEMIEDCGIAVRLPNWWKKRLKPQVNVTIGERSTSRLGLHTLMDFDVRMVLGEEELTPEEIRALLDGEDGLVMVKGMWVEVDRQKLREALRQWEKIYQGGRNGSISFFEGMRLLAGAPNDLKVSGDLLEEDHSQWVHISAGKTLRKILDKLQNPDYLNTLHDMDGFRAELRPYQKEGVSWLAFLCELGLGACLADDMGLGKTIQVLALLEYQRMNRNGSPPSLLIVPASLLGNWKSEAGKFTPQLRLLFLHASEMGSFGSEIFKQVPESELSRVDLVVTTYSMLIRIKWIPEVRWKTIILDEAQAIRNPGTKQSRVTRKLQAENRVVLTGTPIENRLLDLWSLFDFLNPGLLGTLNTFKKFTKYLEQENSRQFAPLRRLIRPYILRRMKTDKRIITDLPEKTEMKRYCNLSTRQIALYKQTVDNLQKLLSTLSGIDRRGLVLQTLLRLKQICNHPGQFTGDGDYDPEQSGKFSILKDICSELAGRQEKVLIFTQFREIIDPLADTLVPVFGRTGLVLHGGTSVRERKKFIGMFQDDEGPPFFVLSLKAGGMGLNLTAASHVIHFDRWWNPAVENQATDRIFRIGQKKNVFIHKFVTRGTVEEHIDMLIEDKKGLAAGVLAGGGELKITEMGDEEILELVQLDLAKAVM